MSQGEGEGGAEAPLWPGTAVAVTPSTGYNQMPETASSSMQTCPACGTEVPLEELYCVACGEPLSPPEVDRFVGRTVAGSFAIEALIGEGAMGKVYKARQLSLDKVVAIKILHRHLAGERDMARRFHREARAASRLNHPNSLHIIDFGQTREGTFYIAMEHIEGVDLLDLLDEGPLDAARIASLMAQVCAALEEAHAAGIVHRDLKPENIMVVRRRDGREDVKVCDFGIAKIQEPKSGESVAPITVAGIVCGTPEYMSPEQGRGEALDGRSDIYSAGVILYQLATGSLPFTADTALGVVTRHLTEEPVPPSVVAPSLPAAHALENVILRAMAKSPEDRYPNALALAADLERVGRGEQIPAYVPAGGARAPGLARSRRRWSIAASAAVAGGVAAGVAVWLLLPRWQGESAPRPEASVALLAPVDAEGRRGVSAPDPSPPPRPEDAGQGGGGAGAPAAGAVPPEPGVAAESDGDARAAKRVADRAPAARPRTEETRPEAVPPRSEPPIPAAPNAFDLGMQAFSTGDIDRAIREFERCKIESPGSARVQRMLGKCYYRIGSIDRGRAAYRRYLELRPDAPDRAYIEAIIGG